MVVTIDREEDVEFLRTLVDECPSATSSQEGERGVRVVEDPESPQNHMIVLHTSKGLVTLWVSWNLWCEECYEHLDDEILLVDAVEGMLDSGLVPQSLRKQAEAFVELRSET